MDDSIPASNVQPPSIPCPRCTFPGPHTLGPGKGPHTAQALCGQCGRHVQWLSTKSPAERAAQRASARQAAMRLQPATRMQREYLARLGYTGPAPQNKLEASEAIKAMLRQREDTP